MHSAQTKLAFASAALLLSAIPILGSITGCAAETSPTPPPNTLSATVDEAPTPSVDVDPAVPHQGTLADAPLKLDVDHSIEHLELGRKTVRGHVFHVLTMSAINTGPASFTFETNRLAVYTTKGLHVSPSSETSSLQDACEAKMILKANDKVTCSLAFEVEQGESDRLVYSLPTQDGVIEHVETKVIAPSTCNIVSKHGAPALERVSHEAAPELIREAVPNGTFFLVQSELFTERGIPSNQPTAASTVVIRDGMFEEVTFDEIVTRTMGSLVNDTTSVNLNCITPARVANAIPQDRVYFSKIENELILERETPNGIQRRHFR